MPNKTNYADLTLYDGVADADKNFRDFRVDIAGIGEKGENSDTRSNFQKIDDILSEHITDNSIHRKIYDISATKNTETETEVTYLATNIQNFNSLTNGMLFFVTVNETNAKDIVYLAINNTNNIALIQKYNEAGEIVDLAKGDLTENVKYLIEYDNYQSSFILISSITANEILEKIKTVDGANSGLDADLLDGQHGNYYATSVQGAKADSAIQSIKGNGTIITPDGNQSVNITYSNVGAVPTTRKVNNKELNTDITLSYGDVGAVPTSRKVNNKTLTGDITLGYGDIGTVPIGNGGTGATSKSDALTNLGLTYQSGTWTPTLGSTGSTQPTYTKEYAEGRFVRIGELCYITFYGKWNITATGSSCACINGLPFKGYTAGSEQAFALREASGITNGRTIVGKIDAGKKRIELKCNDGTTVTTFNTGNAWFGFSGVYQITPE